MKGSLSAGTPWWHSLIVWGGAALFAGSLGYFLYTYAVTFGEMAAGPVRLADVVTDIALFAIFGTHHSIFAREHVRAWVARTASPGLERAIYVWVASLMLTAVCLLWRPIPGAAWQVTGAARWLLHGMQLAGLWLTLRSAAIIDIWDLAGVRQGRGQAEGRPATPMEFKTNGPYGLVRHPIYLGWVLIVFAMPTMTLTRLLFAVLSTAYILIAIPFEERSLRRASSGAYDDYSRRVRWKLVPRLY